MNNLINEVDPILLILIILILGFSFATIYLIVKNKIKRIKKTAPLNSEKKLEPVLKTIYEEKKVVNDLIERSTYKYNNDNLITEVNEPFEDTYSIIKIEESGNSFNINKPVVFYMSKPVDNYFPVTAKSDKAEGTIYKFSYILNDDYAQYEIHCNGAPVKEILKRANSYLLPACIEDNLSNENTKNILTLKPGKVFLSDNKWIIQNKAIIKYE